jgi:hypothetical protein
MCTLGYRDLLNSIAINQWLTTAHDMAVTRRGPIGTGIPSVGTRQGSRPAPRS